MGSGALDVFATPAVVAYMEMAACYAVNDLLEEGLSTVGTKIDIAHIANGTHERFIIKVDKFLAKLQ